MDHSLLGYLFIEKSISLNAKKILPFINLGLFIAFLFCYLSWGKDQSAFIFEVEYQVLKEQDLVSAVHPIILAGFIGQVLLLYAIIRPNAKRWWNIVGVSLLSVIAGIILLVGLLSLQAPVILSTTPFFILLYVFFRINRLLKKNQQ